MKNIDMIVMDMDGTLLTSQQKILPYTKEILMHLQKQGVALVLASGRDVNSLEFYGKQLDMHHYLQSGYIVLNGLEIYNSKKECLYAKEKLSREDVLILDELAQKYSFDMIIFFEKGLYILNHGHTGIMEDHFIDREKHKVENVEDIPYELFTTVKKVAFIQDETIINDILPDIQKQMSDRFEICKVEKDWIEVNPLHATKGQALLQLSKIKKIPIQNIVAFGNGENDIDMLEMAGYGIAMENSFDTVKAVADDICLDNEHDGIGIYLKERMANSC